LESCKYLITNKAELTLFTIKYHHNFLDFLSWICEMCEGYAKPLQPVSSLFFLKSYLIEF
jgi:hypothetical protein